MSKFSKSEALSFGWSQTKANLIFFLGILLTTAVVQFIPGWLSESVKKNIPFLSFILNIIGWIVQILITMGLIKVSLKLHDGAHPEFAAVVAAAAGAMAAGDPGLPAGAAAAGSARRAARR